LKCNNKKGDRTLSEIGWQLDFTPKMPQGLAWTVRGADKQQPEWQDYLEMQRAA